MIITAAVVRICGEVVGVSVFARVVVVAVVMLAIVFVVVVLVVNVDVGVVVVMSGSRNPFCSSSWV